MSTAISPARLVEMRAAASLTVTRFVDPHACNRAETAIRRRGEAWAAAICGRPFDRRSIARPSLPWLLPGEPSLLTAADVEEDRARFDRIAAAPDDRSR